MVSFIKKIKMNDFNYYTFLSLYSNNVSPTNWDLYGYEMFYITMNFNQIFYLITNFLVINPNNKDNHQLFSNYLYFF